MKRFEAEYELDGRVKELTGIKGFLVRKVWPIIKDIIIDLLLEVLKKEKKSKDNKPG